MTLRSKTPPNLTGQGNTEFNKENFDSAVWKFGYDVILEKARQCPCTKNGHGLSSCQNCRGTGWFFINPIKTKAIIQSLNKDTKFKDWSIEKEGSYQITVDDRDKLSFMDRITLINAFSEVSELLTVKTFNSKVFSFTTYEIEEIIDGFLFNGDSNSLMKLVNEAELKIKEDNSFVAEITKSLTGDPAVSKLSLFYKHKVQVHVLDLPHNIRSSWNMDENGNRNKIDLPINAIGRSSHLIFNRPDYESGVPIDNSYL